MIISLPKGLPAAQFLRDEGLVVVDENCPVLPMLKPVRIALVNLMPNKSETELQFARLLGHAPHPVELTLVRPAAHVSRNTPDFHLERHYKTIPEILGQAFDGLIVTGAPVEQLDFADVDYWQELEALFDWADRCVSRSLYICWSAQAVLHHRFGVDKHPMPHKASGVFEQKVLRMDSSALLGLGEAFSTPVSRYTEVRAEDLEQHPELDILAASDVSGVCMVEDTARGALMMFNHLEYDTISLDAEYRRDCEAGLSPAVPTDYYRDGEPDGGIDNLWRDAARKFYANWIIDTSKARGYPAPRERDRQGRLAHAG